MHSRNINVDSERVSMFLWTVGLIKIDTFNTRTPIYTVACNKFTCNRTVNFLNSRSYEWIEDFFPYGSYLIAMVSKRRLTFWFLSYSPNRDSFQNCIWVNFKPLPMFFDVVGFFGGLISRFETTGPTWYNLEQSSSRYFIWLLFLL